MFQFKHFTIHQDRCAMKVCTDACIFGAWVAGKIERKIISPESILDIGTGTGLLALMLAQKSSATVDAIEVDRDAFLQAEENISQSPFAKNIQLHHCSLQNYLPRAKYDLIICNPPFYQAQLASPDEKKNAAMHSSHLTLTEVCASLENLLTDNGSAAILLPFERATELEKILFIKGLNVDGRVDFSHSPQHANFRSCFLIGKLKKSFTKKSFSIRTSEGQYSTPFKSLLQDYYLHL